MPSAEPVSHLGQRRGIERLFEAGGEARFERYLHAIPAKLVAWQGARDVDLETRSQAEFAVLLGGLDFEA